MRIRVYPKRDEIFVAIEEQNGKFEIIKGKDLDEVSEKLKAYGVAREVFNKYSFNVTSEKIFSFKA